MNNNKTLVEKFSEKIGIEPDKLLMCLKSTVFRQPGDKSISNEQMMALIVVAHEHNLNPLKKELYAFPTSNGGVIPYIGVDGWTKIMNSNPNYDGIEFKYSETESTIEGSKKCYDWIECTIHRKDRKYPTIVREFLDENFKSTIPWKTYTKRKLRHVALVQCVRVAFSMGGIYDEDEAREIVINTEKVINPEIAHIETDLAQFDVVPKPKTKAEEILLNLKNKSKTPEQLDDEFYIQDINDKIMDMEVMETRLKSNKE